MFEAVALLNYCHEEAATARDRRLWDLTSLLLRAEASKALFEEASTIAESRWQCLRFLFFTGANNRG
jgi:hypothetical protein